jgi:hypothetical protein
METSDHRRLKRFALEFLAHHGCSAYALEVRCPLSRWRLDAAGYLDSRPAAMEQRDGAARREAAPRRTPCEPRTIIIECKQERGDFLRDGEETPRLIAERERLHLMQRRMEEERLKVLEPHLRRSGSALFPELEDWDFASSRLGGYRDVLRRLRRLDEQIHGETKFCMIARYRLADRLYIAAPRGLIRRREVPRGWGLLECPVRLLLEPPSLFEATAGPALTVTVVSPEHGSGSTRRQRLLRNLAVAATRAAAFR